MKTSNHFSDDLHFQVLPYQLNMNVLSPFYCPKLKRKHFSKQPIYTIPKLLSAKESKSLISKAEQLGFQVAGLAYAQDQYRIKAKTRNNLRVIFEDHELASQLWGRMGHLTDSNYNNHYVKGLNWRFRIYKYEKGHRFTPHVDEQMILNKNPLQKTLFTFMIYLNENMNGGQTTFFHPRIKRQKGLKSYKSIRPKTGMALAFDHLLFHEGEEVTKGVKYVLRSDIIYEK